MVVQLADHPLILACELEIRLPEAVTMLPLEPTLTPNPSRRGNRIVQSSLDEDPVNRSVADRRDPLNLIVPRVAFDLVRTPMFATPQLHDEVHGYLRSLAVVVGSSGFDP